MSLLTNMAALINTVFIKTRDHDSMRQSLVDWIDMYSEALEYDLEFRFYKSDNETCIIEADKELDNKLFVFLINYLVFPIDINNETEVTGFTLIDNSGELSPAKPGEQIMMFIPPFDEEHDIVCWIVASGQAYKTDMGFKTIEIPMSKQFAIPDIDFSQLPEPEVIR